MTGPESAPPTVDLDTIVGTTIERSSCRFDDLPDPSTTSAVLSGRYRGHITSLRWLDRLPAAVVRPIFGVLARAAVPWFGKRFADADGTNVWRVGRSVEFGAFSIERPTQGPILLDYAVDDTPRALHPILGELRPAGGGRWWGRMLWRRPGGAEPLHVMYFLLEPVS